MRLCVFAAMVMVAAGASAHYSIHSLEGDVKIKHGSSEVQATGGMKITAADLIVIGRGAKVAILDSSDSKIYESSTPGQYTATNIVFQARKLATSNTRKLNRNLQIGNSGGKETTVYVEKGKVTRALEVYDPAGDSLQLDMCTLASFVVSKLRNPAKINDTPFPISVNHSRSGADALQISLENTLGFPVYFNIIKVGSKDGKPAVSLSELGQPVGSYVLLPNQILSREQSLGLNTADTHILIMAHYYFEVDALIESISKAMLQNAPKTGDLPVYLVKL